jgi:hypothetical protein
MQRTTATLYFFGLRETQDGSHLGLGYYPHFYSFYLRETIKY